MIEKVIKRLEYCAENKCDICQEENGSGFPWIDGRCYGFTERLYDVLALLESQELRECEDTNKARIFCCSVCGYKVDDIYIDEQRFEYPSINFCPNCGAKINKEK